MTQRGKLTVRVSRQPMCVGQLAEFGKEQCHYQRFGKTDIDPSLRSFERPPRQARQHLLRSAATRNSTSNRKRTWTRLRDRDSLLPFKHGAFGPEPCHSDRDKGFESLGWSPGCSDGSHTPITTLLRQTLPCSLLQQVLRPFEIAC